MVSTIYHPGPSGNITPDSPPLARGAFFLLFFLVAGCTNYVQTQPVPSPNYFNYIDFNTGISNPSHLDGRLFYDSDDNSLAYYNDNENLTINIAREMVSKVKNVENRTIYRGEVVYIQGTSGEDPTVRLAKADRLDTSRMVGMVAVDSIRKNAKGYVTSFGRVKSVNTSAYPANTTLYLSPDTKGQLTDIKPTKPEIAMRVGEVVRSSESSGVIFIDNDREIDNFESGRIIFSNGGGELFQSVNLTYNHTSDRMCVSCNDANSSLQVGTPNAGQIDYLQIDSLASVPPAEDCDEDKEAGRMVVDNNPGADRLYVCAGATDGWVSASLT